MQYWSSPVLFTDRQKKTRKHRMNNWTPVWRHLLIAELIKFFQHKKITRKGQRIRQGKGDFMQKEKRWQPLKSISRHQKYKTYLKGTKICHTKLQSYFLHFLPHIKRASQHLYVQIIHTYKDTDHYYNLQERKYSH